ncbi:uncharacterized protein KNAG_0A05740 [Huiozyma naganishii CBS 8797]|uniref:Dolichyl-phosphate-mannose--protein mannosyltransferase n=1 Tax=Huiozyma naganishii (strain ATCC MYA-139 / BCRC 22969 / CBS 8797 / KCTC 17520 / NBRC 10181 / NCYC 3082 / Yp74L-3) TaxID=1071383 RepID=J7RTX6_HUIN7|nr:hypothetical protein KNAG_0A05740 [Kazachstania naganishii CBS 8797]CCK68237.1 hypothetical protein KNAG_0A05740 [Kazachstania naganishii CBS 8797]
MAGIKDKKSSKKASVTAAEKQLPPVEVEVKRGPQRPYIVSGTSDEIVQERVSTSLVDKLCVAGLICVGAGVRFQKLEWPTAPVYHEREIATAIEKYANKEFFVAMVPPFINLMYSVVAKFAGYDGTFPIIEGDLLDKNGPYVALRFFSSFLGLFTSVLLFATLRLSGIKSLVAAAVSGAFIFENGHTTVSRLFLEDSPIAFLVAVCVFLFKKSELYDTGSCKSYSFFVGSLVAAGCLVGSKWSGAFIIGWIFLMLAWKFILRIGDLTKPVVGSIKHTFVKGFLLLVVPFVVYMAVFFVHFQYTTVASHDSNILSAAYRNSLTNSNMVNDVKGLVLVGSRISLRHVNTYGGYLHSHQMYYPKGSNQRQISLYPFIDENNDWTIELYDHPNEVLDGLTKVIDGTKIRLRHPSQCRLHSHDHKPPISEHSDWQKEVSCYGYAGFDGDANDDWIVEIDKKASKKGPAQHEITAIDTRFRLKHAMTGCYLFSHNVKLADIGMDQQEVTCASSGIDSLTLWYVEENENDDLPFDTPRVSYSPISFWAKFKETHEKMKFAIRVLELPHSHISSPLSWPFMLTGNELYSVNYENVYFLGNAIMWWSSTLFIVVFGVVCASELIAWQLGKSILQDSYLIRFHLESVEDLLGYATFMTPLILLGGNHYINEYLPGYYFAILALAQGLDAIVNFLFRKNKPVGYAIVASFMIANVYFFNNRKDIIYAGLGNSDACYKTQWLSSWDYNCDSYYLTYDDYKATRTQNRLTDDSTSLTFIFPESTVLGEFDQEPPVVQHDEDGESNGLNGDEDGESNGLNGDEDVDIMERSNVVYVDENGNKIAPEVVKSMVEEEGAILNKGE